MLMVEVSMATVVAVEVVVIIVVVVRYQVVLAGNMAVMELWWRRY